MEIYLSLASNEQNWNVKISQVRDRKPKVNETLNQGREILPKSVLIDNLEQIHKSYITECTSKDSKQQW